MGFWEQFPYTNFHEMNLEWLLKAIKDLQKYVENYVAINKVGYAGIWDITKQYPQWSIVSTDNKTYMSKVAVPSGVAIDNEDYWIELADLDPRIGGIINTLDRLENELTADLAANLAVVNRRIDALQNGHIVFIGDSYMTGVGGTQNIIPSTIGTALQRPWHNFAVGGSGFIRNPDNGRFINQILTAKDDGSYNNDDVADVVIMGGYNDLGAEGYDYDDFVSAAKECCIAARTYFPKARITCVCMPWINIPFNSDYRRMSDALRAGATSGGANAVEGLTWLLFLDDNVQSGDYIHPSDTGYAIIAQKIMSAMQGCDPIDTYTIEQNSLLINVEGWCSWNIRGVMSYAGNGDLIIDVSNVRGSGNVSNMVFPVYKYGQQTGDPLYAVFFQGVARVGSDFLEAGALYIINTSFKSL